MTRARRVPVLARAAPLAATILGAAFSLFLVLHARSANGAGGFPLDDPWIHLTYAWNLRFHGTFAYFPGDPTTAGSTSPLYTLLLGLGFLLTTGEKLLSYALGIGFHILFLLALGAWAGRRLGSPLWAAAAVLLVAFDGRIALLSVSGMETSLFLLTIALAFLARLQGRRALTGIALGLSVWARPEGLILLGVFLLDLLLGRVVRGTAPAPGAPRALARAALPAALLLLAYGTFNATLGEAVLPNTFAAKTAYYRPNPAWTFLRNEVWPAFSSGPWIVLLPFALGSMAREAWRLLRREEGIARAEAGWTLGLTLAYVLLLPFSHRFHRYLVPALPALAVLGLRGLQDAARRFSTPGLSPAAFATAVLLLAAGGLAAASAAAADRDYRTLCRYHLARHERAGRWLAEHTPPGSVIATHDVGAIAFYSRRRIVDTVGVVLPEAVAHLHSEGYIDYLRELFRRTGVTHLAVLRDWLEVVNVEPLLIADPEPEILEIFAWVPGKTHLLHPLAGHLNRQAVLELQGGKPAVSEQLLSRSLSIDGRSSRTWFLLGAVEERLGRLDEAEAAARRSLDLFPAYPDGRYLLAAVLARRDRKREARDLLEGLLRDRPDHPGARQLLDRLRS